MLTLLISTRNEHKVGEIRAILGSEFRYLTLRDFPKAPNVVEDAPTFAGNAIKKAVELAKWLSQSNGPEHAVDYIVADDSGLEVDALSGAPGVQSARFSAAESGLSGNSSPAANNAKLLRLLKDVPPEKRTARFRCVVALTPALKTQTESSSPVCYADEFELHTRIFEGACEGRIGFELKGQGGFGYDPLFIPDGFDQTFAELGEELKNGLSHRGRALEQLKKKVLTTDEH